METTILCRCCLFRPPDKDLKTPYLRLGSGIPEVYMDMLEKCFEIHVILGNDDEGGICEVCVRRLRDASDFKLQVQSSQAELQARLAVLLVKDEEPEIKSESAENRTFDVTLPEVLSEKSSDVNNGDMLDEEPAVTSEASDDAASDDDGVSQTACDEYEPDAARCDHTYERTEFPPEIDPLLDENTAGARDQLAMTRTVARDSLSDKQASFTGKSISIDQKPYRCKICLVEFSGEINFTDHLTTHIGPKGNCGICHEDFPSTPALISHIIKHTGQYNCDVCKRQFVTEWQLLSHDHTPYACDICNVNLTHQCDHMKTHTKNIRYLCYYCNTKFEKKIDLRRHERTHTDGKPYSCNLCKRQFKQKGSLKRHMLVHTDERPFRCSYCDKKFKDNDRLKKHTIIHSLKKYTCDICKFHFSRKSHLLRHINKHTEKKPYPCKYSNTIFENSIDLRRHVRTHTDEEVYSCNICKEQYKQEVSLKRHMLVHTEERPFCCKYCEKIFKDYNRLKKHIIIHSVNRKYYTCDICQKQCAFKPNLIRHIRVHTGEKPYACKHCNKTFADQSYARKHERSHIGEKPHRRNICKQDLTQKGVLKVDLTRQTEQKSYPCDKCTKSFTLETDLNSHISIHTRHNCEICKQGFTRKILLRKHIRSHKESVLDLTSLSCGICKKQFTTRNLLQMHIRIHTDQKLYLCEFCSKSFRLRGQLKVHTMLHTGEKPYGCEICKKQFLSKGNLTVHMRIHTLQFPYTCDYCSKKFYCRSNLKKHIRSHSGVKPYSCKICNKRFICSRSLSNHDKIHSGHRPYSCKECSWQFKCADHLKKHEKRFHARENMHNSEEGIP